MTAPAIENAPLPTGCSAWGPVPTIDYNPVERLLGRLAAVGGDCDLATLVLMEELKKVDSQVNTKMQQIREASQLRDAYSKRLDELRLMKEQVRRDEDQCLKRKHVAGDTRTLDFERDPKTGVVGPRHCGKDGGYIGGSGDPEYEIKVTDMELEEKRLETQLHSLESQNDIEMIKLNGLINKKGQITQLLSNIQKKQDETSRAIIGNMR